MPEPGAEASHDTGAGLGNAHVAAVLLEIADLLELKGESSFKVGAYRRAADSVARAPVDVAAAFRAGRPPTLGGVGDTIAARIAELAIEGHIDYHDALRDELPPALLTLRAIPGLGPRTIGEIWRVLGIATAAELEAAARDGRLQQVRGISARTEERILAGLGELAQRPPRRMLMEDAHRLAAGLVGAVERLPGVRSAVVAGSVRRFCETVGDLDLLVETEHPGEVLASLAELPAFEPVISAAGDRGRERLTLRLIGGPDVDVMTMPPGTGGSYLVHFTGSAEHNVALRHRARQRGWSLSEHGLRPLAAADEPDDRAAADIERAPELRTFVDEAALYRALDLELIEPELREGRGEVESAEAGTLPRLLTLADLRGDCHSHTDWSDGRESLAVMADSAREAGRRYQVITDHSRSLGVANGLTPDRVEQQRRAIGELNERFAREHATGGQPAGAHGDGFRLLHGCELEITVDGRLDYDDALLSTFDVVVASLHVGRRQPRPQLMARYERAMHDRHVDIISHPSGRKIGRRPDLDLDWDTFYRWAAETGTLLEVNGSQERLDLDEQRIRAAHAAGCRFVVSSDAHDRAEWQNLAWGVAIARRGWLTAADVANTADLEAFLGALD